MSLCHLASLITSFSVSQCQICRQTFLCTSNQAKLQEHVDSKHAKQGFTVSMLTANTHPKVVACSYVIADTRSCCRHAFPTLGRRDNRAMQICKWGPLVSDLITWSSHLSSTNNA